MTDTHDYLIAEIEAWKRRYCELRAELERATLGFRFAIADSGDDIFVICECPKCHLKTVTRKLP